MSGIVQKGVVSGLKALQELSDYQTTAECRNYVFAVGTALRAGEISGADAKKLLKGPQLALRRLEFRLKAKT